MQYRLAAGDIPDRRGDELDVPTTAINLLLMLHGKLQQRRAGQLQTEGIQGLYAQRRSVLEAETAT